jgi:phospholipid/cholesterol/gamma-HCH transport system substrate-binding protein
LNISNESKVGILAAVGIALLYLGVSYLKGVNIFNRGENYYVEYPYAGGVADGDPVQVDGYTVGRVTAVSLQTDQSGVDIVINMTEKITIPDDSYAMIRGDLLGTKYIDLNLGESKNIIPPGGKIRGTIETDITNQIREELKPLTEKVKSMVVSLDTAINVLRGIFTDEVKSDFQNSMSSIKKTLESFNQSAVRVNEIIVTEQSKIYEIITDMQNITGYVDESEGDVKTTIENLRAVSESLKQVNWPELTTEMQTAITQLNEVAAKIDTGEGSLGMLVNDPKLYDDLVQTLTSLKTVLDDFGQNPEIRLILFGGKKKEGEDAPK